METVEGYFCASIGPDGSKDWIKVKNRNDLLMDRVLGPQFHIVAARAKQLLDSILSYDRNDRKSICCISVTGSWDRIN